LKNTPNIAEIHEIINCNGVTL